MIHSVKIKNYLNEELVMELRSPEKSGFAVFNMTGIGPGKAEIHTTDIVTTDGGLYNSSRLPIRNIVLSLRFFSWNGKTVEEIRHESYKFFPIQKPLTLTIETDNRIGEIVGYVESNEPVIFSRETHTQLSIICPFPYFYSAGADANNVTVFSGVESLFEFPFSNEIGGRNLISPRNISLPSTVNGLTLSYDDISNIYTLNGVNNTDASIMFTTIFEEFDWTKDQSYSLSYFYVSGTMTDTVNINPSVYESYINETNPSEQTIRSMIAFGGNHENFDYTKTNAIIGVGSADALKWKFQLIALPKTTFNNLQFKLQFELGEPTPWRPYQKELVGNLIPTPTGFPKTTNGFLFDYDLFSETYIVDGIYNGPPNVSSAQSMYNFKQIPFKATNNEYLLAFNYISGELYTTYSSGSALKIMIFMRDINENNVRVLDLLIDNSNHKSELFLPLVLTESEVEQIISIQPFISYRANDGSFYTDYRFQLTFKDRSDDNIIRNIEFGEIKSNTEGVISYNGDAEIGITIFINAIGPAKNITIYNIDTRESMKIDSHRLTLLTGSGIVAGDEIILTTIKGSKRIFLLRAGVYINILNTLDRNTDWFQLSKGDNIFAFSAEEGLTNLKFRIENRTIYEGM